MGIDRAFCASFPTIPYRTDVINWPVRGSLPSVAAAATTSDRPLPSTLAECGYATQLIHDTPHLVNGGHNFDWPFHAWTFIRGAEVDSRLDRRFRGLAGQLVPPTDVCLPRRKRREKRGPPDLRPSEPQPQKTRGLELRKVVQERGPIPQRQCEAREFLPLGGLFRSPRTVGCTARVYEKVRRAAGLRWAR